MKKSLTEIEWITCWMAVAYAIGRETIYSAFLPKEMMGTYWGRWSESQRQMLVRDLRSHLDYAKQFGDKTADHPVWMKFLFTLDENEHYIAELSDGTTLKCIRYEGRYYPISGKYTWWNSPDETYIDPDKILNVEKIWK